MDLVLEAYDRYIFDRVYAWVLPASPGTAPNITAASSSLLSSLPFNASTTVFPDQLASIQSNTTTFDDQIANSGFVNLNGFDFKRASQYMSFEPTELAYQSRLPRDHILRQAVTLYVITWLFGLLIYFAFGTFSYYFIFDKETFKHPKFLKNQVKLEIGQTLKSIPIMAMCTIPFFLAEVRGYSKMYDITADGPGMWYNWLQFPLFLLFTDFSIYWIHRGLHHPLIYKYVHKPHHKWIMPTPFASHAFHPLDGYAQSLPYHIFPFIFPLQKLAYVGLFIFINIWTVMIHDGEYVSDNPVINGAACHSVHHLKFEYNYGQYTTAWDRIGGTYRPPPRSVTEQKPSERRAWEETKAEKEDGLKQS